MRKIALAVMLAALLSIVSLAADNSQTFSGEIMDDMCATMGSHDMMLKSEGAKNARECTLACVHDGSKFVLFDGGNKTVYQLDDQKKPAEFAGEKVTIKGTLDQATKTIHVESISKA